MKLDTRKFFIGGKWVAPLRNKTLPVENPASEAEFAVISLAGAADVDRAVSAALSAQEQFSRTSIAERKALLNAILSVYRGRAEELAEVITQELGAPADLARNAQVGVGFGHLKAFSQALDGLSLSDTLENGDLIRREPIGVAALITPWNWPIHQIFLKVIAAYCAGCTVVLKPSEITPLNAMILAEIFHEAGCPAGVFNLVNGDGPEAGEALVRHKDVAMVSFTGSTSAGVAVSIAAAQSVKKVALELGGKSPALLFADANIDVALASTLAKIFDNAGQNCNAPTRLLVERAIYDETCAKVADLARSRRVDQPVNPGNFTGPVASAKQFAHIQKMIASGLNEGATLLAGGLGKPHGFERGYFVRPTVFGDVRNDMEIARQEIFGPVLCVLPFENENEAVALANDTDFGLAAYVHSSDKDRIARLIHRLQAGMVFCNGADISFGSPFGGCKRSGVGREGGALGIEEFLEIKLVAHADA
jgi:aldehyde dehydrogenase (NAD+)